MEIIMFYLDTSDPDDAKIWNWYSGLGHKKTRLLRAISKQMMRFYPECNSNNIDHVIYMIENGYFLNGGSMTGILSNGAIPASAISKPKRTRKVTKKSKPQERSPTSMPRNRPQLIIPDKTPEAVVVEKPKEVAPPEVAFSNIPESEMTDEQRHEYHLSLLRKMQWSGDGTWDDDLDEQ